MTKQYLIIGVVATLLIGSGAFAMMSRGDSNPLSSVVATGVTKLFNAECRYNDAELCKFMNNWDMPSEYAMHATMSSKSASKTEYISRVNGEDTHMIMKESGKVTHESITLAGTNYIKDFSDGAWWKIMPEKIKDNPAMPEHRVTEEFNYGEKMTEVEDKTTYVRLGMETCGDAECYKYQIFDPENKETKEYIWFDKKDYLMRKSLSEEILGDMSISESIMSYGNIVIATPAPVKEGTSLDAYGSSSSMSKTEIAELKKQQLEGERAAAEYMKTGNWGGMNAQTETSYEMPPQEPSGDQVVY